MVLFATFRIVGRSAACISTSGYKYIKERIVEISKEAAGLFVCFFFIRFRFRCIFHFHFD